MSTVTGVVEKVDIRNSPNGASKKWTKYGFLVNGEWYSVFENADNKGIVTKASPGAVVSIDYEHDGKYTVVKSFRLDSTATPTGLDRRSRAARQETAQVKAATDAFAEKDFRITYLASRRDAIEFVIELIKLDVLALPTKKADKADAIYEYVKYYASLMAADSFSAKNVANEVNPIKTKELNNKNESSEQE